MSRNSRRELGEVRYSRDVLNTDMTNNNNLPSMKLLLLGDTGVGKSSIMLRYTDNAFDHTMVSTAGVDFKVKTIEVRDEKSQEMKQIALRIWDTAGQERFKTITQTYYRGASGILIVYDVTDRRSFEHVEHWMKNIVQHGSALGPAVLYLAANKVDRKSSRVVSQEEGQNLANNYNIGFLEVSAKGFDGNNKAEEDEARGYMIEELFTSLATRIYNSHDAFRRQYVTPMVAVELEQEETTSSGCC